MEEKGSYQRDVILPGASRLLDLKKGETLVDIACGTGFFSREFHKLGVKVVGVDAAPELIQIAKKQSSREIAYYVSDVKNMSFLRSGMADAAVIILALQNIDDIAPVMREARRVLKLDGRLVFVINHPAFRIPKLTGWGWDEGQRLQYRRVNGYMTELKVPIEMHPGERKREVTWSFHRPLQFYFGALRDAGFAVADLEEWISHKVSQPGPKAKTEDRARKEFPMFLAVKAVS